MTRPRSRTWSTSCSSTTSHSSIASIYSRITQSPPLAEPAGANTNVYGSFTTTAPAALWLRSHLTLNIPVPGMCRPDLHRGCDTPPDSPLSFFHPPSGSRRSPSISRTLLTDFDWDNPCTAPAPSPTSPSSPSVDSLGRAAKLHPTLAAVENSSKLSCRTICSSCMKKGTNFPRCPRCDETWCSRACRLQGGKKHVCATRRM